MSIIAGEFGSANRNSLFFLFIHIRFILRIQLIWNVCGTKSLNFYSLLRRLHVDSSITFFVFHVQNLYFFFQMTDLIKKNSLKLVIVSAFFMLIKKIILKIKNYIAYNVRFFFLTLWQRTLKFLYSIDFLSQTQKIWFIIE